MHLSFFLNTIYVVSCILLSVPASSYAKKTHLLRPYIRGNLQNDADGSKLQKRESTIIRGLLQTRQSCDSGYGLCAATGVCCPINGDCCTNNRCCDPGWACCGQGSFCCPDGYNCCSNGTCCKSSEYCVDGGCCPLGELCVGDAGGDGGDDDDGGDGDETTTQRATTTKTTSKPTPTTSDSQEGPDIPDFTITPSGSNSTSSPTATFTGSSSPSPTPPIGQKSIVYSVDDERITWSSGWVTSSSGCTSSAKKTTTSMESFTVMVSSASQIYLNIDCSNAAYQVYVDDEVQVFDDFEVTETCSYKQLQTTISTTNINVTVVVIGVLMSGKRQTSDLSNWSFQTNQILAMDSSSGGTGLATGSAHGLGVPWTNGFAAVVLAGLGLVL